MTTTPDPRPSTTTTDAVRRLAGSRCSSCGHPMLWASPACPLCASPTVATDFGPDGTVWSSTVVRVPVPNRTPPYALAYVDLDDGPRVLAHVAEHQGTHARLAVGTRVRLVDATVQGDVQVEVLA